MILGRLDSSSTSTPTFLIPTELSPSSRRPELNLLTWSANQTPTNLVNQVRGGPRGNSIGFVPIREHLQCFLFGKACITELAGRSKRGVVTTLAGFRVNAADVGDCVLHLAGLLARWKSVPALICRRATQRQNVESRNAPDRPRGQSVEATFGLAGASPRRRRAALVRYCFRPAPAGSKTAPRRDPAAGRRRGRGQARLRRPAGSRRGRAAPSTASPARSSTARAPCPTACSTPSRRWRRPRSTWRPASRTRSTSTRPSRTSCGARSRRGASPTPPTNARKG